MLKGTNCGILKGVSKSLISRDVVFREDQMFMNVGREFAGKISNDQSCVKQVELEFQNDSDHQDNELEVDDQNQEEQVPTEHEKLHDYQLAKDRMRRQIKAPAKYAHAEVASYAFNIAEELENTEPLTFKEAVTHVDKQI